MQPQDVHRKAVAVFRVWIRTLRGIRYPGIGSLSEYEPILKILAIYMLNFQQHRVYVESYGTVLYEFAFIDRNPIVI